MDKIILNVCANANAPENMDGTFVQLSIAMTNMGVSFSINIEPEEEGRKKMKNEFLTRPKKINSIQLIGSFRWCV